MSVAYKDYYKILGVARDATAEQIKQAYRAKAKELHPDRNKDPKAKETFRDVNEAYEVLGDVEKRKRYDQLGSGFRHGAPFTPPPGFEGFRVQFGDLGDLSDIGLGDLFGAGRGGGFSDFFETLFGGAGARAAGGRTRRGRDLQAQLDVSLSDLIDPGPKQITISMTQANGQRLPRTINVNLPAGVRPGQKVRLAGQGGDGADLYLLLKLQPESGFPGATIDGDDLVLEADVPAPIATIGGEKKIGLPDGQITLRIPAGTPSGRLLRVRGRGLKRKDGKRGDLKVRVRLTVPEKPTAEQKALYEKLAKLEN